MGQFIFAKWHTDVTMSKMLKSLNNLVKRDFILEGYKPTANNPSGILAELDNYPLAYYDIPTLNRQTFRKKLWEMLLQNEDLMYRMKESRSFWGEPMHSDSMEVIFPNVSHKVTDFRIGNDNLIPGSVAITDTPYGNIIYSLMKDGAVGISSRGWGDLIPDENDDTNQIVSEDSYMHVCWDFVGIPAVPIAMKTLRNDLKQNKILDNIISYLENQKNKDNDKILSGLKHTDKKYYFINQSQDLLVRVQELEKNNKLKDIKQTLHNEFKSKSLVDSFLGSYLFNTYVLPLDNMKMKLVAESLEMQGLKTAIFSAIGDESESVKDKNVDIGVSGDNRKLFYAVKNGNIEEINRILETGVDVNLKAVKDFTPLMVACLKGSFEVAKLLLMKGANPNAQNIYGSTSLHYMVDDNLSQIADLLIANGADVNIKDKNGRTPLFYCKNIKLVNLLSDSGANIDEIDEFGWTYLIFCINKNFREGIEFALNKGSNINHKDNFSKTPMIYAVSNDDYQTFKQLVDLGADTEIKDQYNKSVWDYFQIYDEDRMEEYLRKVQKGKKENLSAAKSVKSTGFQDINPKAVEGVNEMVFTKEQFLNMLKPFEDGEDYILSEDELIAYALMTKTDVNGDYTDKTVRAIEKSFDCILTKLDREGKNWRVDFNQNIKSDGSGAVPPVENIADVANPIVKPHGLREYGFKKKRNIKSVAEYDKVVYVDDSLANEFWDYIEKNNIPYVSNENGDITSFFIPRWSYEEKMKSFIDEYLFNPDIDYTDAVRVEDAPPMISGEGVLSGKLIGIIDNSLKIYQSENWFNVLSKENILSGVIEDNVKQGLYWHWTNRISSGNIRKIEDLIKGEIKSMKKIKSSSSHYESKDKWNFAYRDWEVSSASDGSFFNRKPRWLELARDVEVFDNGTIIFRTNRGQWLEMEDPLKVQMSQSREIKSGETEHLQKKIDWYKSKLGKNEGKYTDEYLNKEIKDHEDKIDSLKKVNSGLEFKPTGDSLYFKKEKESFDVFLDGEKIGEVFWNISGYTGSVKINGITLPVGEGGISRIKREIQAFINDQGKDVSDNHVDSLSLRRDKNGKVITQPSESDDVNQSKNIKSAVLSRGSRFVGEVDGFAVWRNNRNIFEVTQGKDSSELEGLAQVINGEVVWNFDYLEDEEKENLEDFMLKNTKGNNAFSGFKDSMGKEYTQEEWNRKPLSWHFEEVLKQKGKTVPEKGSPEYEKAYEEWAGKAFSFNSRRIKSAEEIETDDAKDKKEGTDEEKGEDSRKEFTEMVLLELNEYIEEGEADEDFSAEDEFDSLDEEETGEEGDEEVTASRKILSEDEEFSDEDFGFPGEGDDLDFLEDDAGLETEDDVDFSEEGITIDAETITKVIDGQTITLVFEDGYLTNESEDVKVFEETDLTEEDSGTVDLYEKYNGDVAEAVNYIIDLSVIDDEETVIDMEGSDEPEVEEGEEAEDIKSSRILKKIKSGRIKSSDNQDDLDALCYEAIESLDKDYYSGGIKGVKRDDANLYIDEYVRKIMPDVEQYELDRSKDRALESYFETNNLYEEDLNQKKKSLKSSVDWGKINQGRKIISRNIEELRFVDADRDIEVDKERMDALMRAYHWDETENFYYVEGIDNACYYIRKEDYDDLEDVKQGKKKLRNSRVKSSVDWDDAADLKAYLQDLLDALSRQGISWGGIAVLESEVSAVLRAILELDPSFEVDESLEMYLKNDYDESSQSLKSKKRGIKSSEGEMVSFGFAISVGDLLEENAKEDGIEVNWDEANEDISQIELNMLGLLKADFVSVSDQGHSGDELIGDCRTNNPELIDMVREVIETEPLRTSSGTLPFDDSELYANTSGKYDIDVSLDFFNEQSESVQSSLDDTGEYSSEELYETYVNGNISDAKAAIKQNPGLLHDVLDYMENNGITTSEISDFRRKMR
jgi:ankyrin repeat protein